MVSYRRLLIIFLFVLAWLTAVGAGYFLSVHKSNNDKAYLMGQIDKTRKDAGLSTASTSGVKDSDYAKIDPWGVKFLATDSSTQIVYSSDTSGLYFDSKSLDSFAKTNDPQSTCEVNSASLGALSQSTKSIDGVASATSDGVVAHIGNYYYVYTHPNVCSSVAKVANEQLRQASIVVSELKGLVTSK